MIETSTTQPVSADAALVERIRAGETELFVELIRPYERTVFALAFSVLKNQADAEDSAQEAFLKAFKYLPQLRSAGTFKSWLFQIAVNEARLRRRKEHAHLFESLDGDRDEFDESDFMPRQVVDWKEIPSETLARKEIRKHLYDALLELPDKYREVFLLRDMQNLNEKEVAEVLKISLSAVKARLHRARLQLREKLAPVFKKRWIDRLPFLKGVKPW